MLCDLIVQEDGFSFFSKQIPIRTDNVNIVNKTAIQRGSCCEIITSKLTYKYLDRLYSNKIRTYRAGVILKYNNKILLVKHSVSDNWGIPKGHREHNEEYAEQTAIRELREETGICVTGFDGRVILIELRYDDGTDLHVYYLKTLNYMPEVTIDYGELCDYMWRDIKDNFKKIKHSRPTKVMLEAISAKST